MRSNTIKQGIERAPHRGLLRATGQIRDEGDFGKPFIAICNPALILADEPTTALDVTVQAQILELLREMKKEFDLSLLLITHDLGVIAETADRVAVMYAGRIVEQGPVREIFRKPLHPYTQGLLASIPGGEAGTRLRAIEGTVPNLAALPPGCTFAPRCPYRMDVCTTAVPALVEVEPEHAVRCYLHADLAEPRIGSTHAVR